MDKETERDLAFLRCLKNVGVDNWEGYDYACDEFRSFLKKNPELQDEDDCLEEGED